MHDGLFIALLNPSLTLVLASAFLILWLHQRHSRYVLLLSAGYAASAGGFLLQYFELPLGYAATKLASNTLFMTAGLLICGAAIKRYGRPLPVAAFAALAVGGLGTLSWFLFVEPNLTARIYAINFALGGISLLVAAELRPVKPKGPADRVIHAVALLSGLNFFARTLLIIHVYGPYESYVGFYGSIYWTTVILSHAILSVVIAMALFTSITLELIADLKRQSETDPLSGLFNRRGFEERAARLLAEGRGKGLATSLVLCDLDHFKAVNDSLGHASGDMVIRAFADFLAEAAEDCFLAGRIGGEEFAVLLPGANLGVAKLFAKGTRSAFSALAVEGLPADRRFTASFGVAERASGEGFGALLGRADQALYAAKNAGRDCVRLASGPPKPTALRLTG
jgi:diguanylate cyclase (GGDEF)-like protein